MERKSERERERGSWTKEERKKEEKKEGCRFAARWGEMAVLYGKVYCTISRKLRELILNSCRVKKGRSVGREIGETVRIKGPEKGLKIQVFTSSPPILSLPAPLSHVLFTTFQRLRR